jgi:hypothetical protein
MQHDAAHGALDPYTELEQTFAQGADLSARSHRRQVNDGDFAFESGR